MTTATISKTRSGKPELSEELYQAAICMEERIRALQSAGWIVLVRKQKYKEHHDEVYLRAVLIPYQQTSGSTRAFARLDLIV